MESRKGVKTILNLQPFFGAGSKGVPTHASPLPATGWYKASKVKVTKVKVTEQDKEPSYRLQIRFETGARTGSAYARPAACTIRRVLFQWFGEVGG